jgi:hypothetical protein
MTLSKAKEVFAGRYYPWAGSEFEREIAEGFPNLGLFNAGESRTVLDFMRGLDTLSRLELARGLLKRFHPEGVKILGETVSDVEKSLVAQLDDFRLIKNAKSMVDSGIKLANKAKLRKTMLAKFKSEFGAQCSELELVGLDPELDFHMECRGWVLKTHFEFNGKHRQLQYWHDIISPTVIKPNRVPAMTLDQFISINGWLGVCSQTQWEYITQEDIELACNAAIKFCGRFFGIAPRLLEGLEFDKITA